MAFLDENGVAQFWAAVKDRLAGAFDSVEFDVAEQAANLMSGDSIATAFGKLAKNYSSLLTSISTLNTNLTSQINTKLNKSDVLANYTTTATGKALDASLGPAIKTKMDLADTLNSNLSDLEGHTKKLKLLSRNRLYDARVVTVEGNQNSDVCSLIFPSSKKYVWILLGFIRFDSSASNIRALLTFRGANPDNTQAENVMYYPTSTMTSTGTGGVSSWGFINPDDKDRTVYMVTHNYSSSSIKYYGAMYAFAICDTSDDTWTPY